MSEKIATKLFHANKVLRKHLKIAKSRQAQRIIKKLKQEKQSSGQESSDKIDKISANLENLKIITLEPYQTHFFSKLAKEINSLLGERLEQLEQIEGEIKQLNKTSESVDLQLANLFGKLMTPIVKDLALETCSFIDRERFRPKKKKEPKEQPIDSKEPVLITVKEEEESFESDYDDEIQDLIKPKRNRPGQRARQKEWEKKYGNQANHLKKARSIQSETSTHKVVKQKLHPSWEAKKKQNSIVAFSGTKITFDS